MVPDSPPHGVLVVDRLAIVRAGLVATVASVECGADRLECVGEAHSARDAVEFCALAKPRVVVLGELVDADQPNTVERLKHPHPAPLIMVLLGAGVPSTALGTVLAAGADGVVRRSAPVQEIAMALTAVLAGERFVAKSLLSDLLGTAEQIIDLREGAADGLTPREREMLVFLAEGRANREIAQSLSLSLATVKSHLVRLYAKLGVTSRSEALGAAVARGLLR